MIATILRSDSRLKTQRVSLTVINNFPCRLQPQDSYFKTLNSKLSAESRIVIPNPFENDKLIEALVSRFDVERSLCTKEALGLRKSPQQNVSRAFLLFQSSVSERKHVEVKYFKVLGEITLSALD